MTYRLGDYLFLPAYGHPSLSSVTVNYKNITELTNLPAFTMYVVTVSAVSSSGVGRWNTIKAPTDDAGVDDN